MRILMLSQNVAYKGGTFARCYGLARGPAALGNDVTIMCAAAQRRLSPLIEDKYGVKIIQSPGVFPFRVRHAGLDPLDIAYRLAFFSRARDFDIIHSFDHRPSVYLPALLLRRAAGIPLIADWCDLWGGDGLANLRAWFSRSSLGRLDTFLERKMHALARGMTVISRQLMEFAREEGMTHIHLLPPGASADLIEPQCKVDMRRKYGLPISAPILVYSGYTSSAMDLLVETFKRVAQENSEAWLVVIGGKFSEARRKLTEAGLANRCRFLGDIQTEHIGEVLACGDVMLLPYQDNPVNRAGFPNKLGDYMAAGRPVITNLVGDSGIMVTEREIGIAVEPTPEAMASALCELLKDEDKQRRLGERARQEALKQSWKNRASEVEAFYRNALQSESALRQ